MVWLQWLREQLSRIHLLDGIWPLEGQETWAAQLVRAVGLPEGILSLFSSGTLSISKTAEIPDQLCIRNISCTYISEAKQFSVCFPLLMESTGDTTKRMNMSVIFLDISLHSCFL